MIRIAKPGRNSYIKSGPGMNDTLIPVQQLIDKLQKDNKRLKVITEIDSDRIAELKRAMAEVLKDRGCLVEEAKVIQTMLDSFETDNCMIHVSLIKSYMKGLGNE